VSDIHKSFPFEIQSNSYPLTMEWKIQTNQSGKWIIESEGKRTEMKGSGSVVVSSSDVQLRFVEAANTSVPTEFALNQNYPNPFNPSTVISYQLPVDSWVKLKVYNTLGEEVATLADGIEVAGFRNAEWNASGMASGIYQVRMTAGDFSQVMKVVLLK